MPRLTLSDDEAAVVGPVLQSYRAERARVLAYNEGIRAAAAVVREWISIELSSLEATAICDAIINLERQP